MRFYRSSSHGSKTRGRRGDKRSPNGRESSRLADPGRTARAIERPDGFGAAKSPSRGEQTLSTDIVRMRAPQCDDRDLERVRDFCYPFIHAGRRRILLDLDHVKRSDTRLVAMLIYVLRLAVGACVRLELRRSPELDALLELCGVRHLLRQSEQVRKPDDPPLT